MSIQKNLNPNNIISLSKATQLLDVSRYGFYKWEVRQEDGFSSSKDEMKLKDEIQKIAVEFPRYGYRRITAELRNRGIPINHKKVLWLMREDNLLCLKKKFKPITTNSNHNLKKYPNQIKNLEITRPDQVWASDITYIQLLKEFVYLSVILDLFTRRCIGWDLSRNIDTDLTLNALHKAINSRWNEKLRERTIHHSDQGVQYAALVYVDCLLDHGIKVSMSNKGNPYENAFAESFIKTIKYEEVYLNEYESFEDALKNIHKFIEEVYNKKRLHSSLGYRSPDDFEHQLNLNSVA
jgi:transposase InsO family protein